MLFRFQVRKRHITFEQHWRECREEYAEARTARIVSAPVSRHEALMESEKNKARETSWVAVMVSILRHIDE